MATKNEFNIERVTFTISERLNQIRDILRAEEESSSSISAEDVRRFWSEYLEKKLPSCPWTAIWKPSAQPPTTTTTPTATPNTSTIEASKAECVQAYHFVDVLRINWLNLTASVEVLGANPQTSRNAADLTNLPLSELFGPIKISDEEDDFDVASGQIAIDHLHFFLQHIWQPWDEDDDEDGPGSDWVSQHLEHRFSVYEDFVENTSASFVYRKLKSLSKEYTTAKEAIKQLRESVENGNEDDLSDEAVMALHELETKCDDIRRKADILENATLRQAFETRRLKRKHAERVTGSKMNCLVWPSSGAEVGSFVQLNSFISSVAELPGFEKSAPTFTCNSLQEAIEKCLPGDVIYLSSGVHSLSDLGDLAAGNFSIIGLNLIDTFIEIVDSELALTIQGGITLENISLSGINCSQFLVLEGGTSVLSKVHISGFNIGVQVCSGAALIARRCEIFDCDRGLEVEAGGCLQAVDVDVFHSKVGIILNGGRRTSENVKLERVTCRCDQNVIIVEDEDKMEVEDILSKSVVIDSSLGEAKIIAHL